MNEFQATVELSRAEAPADDRGTIAGLIQAGRFVVVSEYLRYCPITDALMGSGKSLVSDHATREEAIVALPDDEEDLFHYVLPRERCPDHPSEDRATCDMHGVCEGMVPDLKDDDIPF